MDARFAGAAASAEAALLAEVDALGTTRRIRQEIVREVLNLAAAASYVAPLVAAGAPVTPVDRLGRSPFHVAAAHCNSHAILLLAGALPADAARCEAMGTADAYDLLPARLLLDACGVGQMGELRAAMFQWRCDLPAPPTLVSTIATLAVPPADESSAATRPGRLVRADSVGPAAGLPWRCAAAQVLAASGWREFSGADPWSRQVRVHSRRCCAVRVADASRLARDTHRFVILMSLMTFRRRSSSRGAQWTLCLVSHR